MSHQTKYSSLNVFEIFKNFLNEIILFLICHLRLIVRIHFQNKNYSDNIEESKEKNIYQIFDKYNDFLSKNNKVPKVSELRKKIYLLLESLEYKNLLII